MLTLLIVLIAACAPQPRPASPLRFLVSGDAVEREVYAQLVAEFERVRPDLHVELEHIPTEQDVRRRLLAEFAAGDPPAVVLLNYRRYGQFAAAGLLEPLGPYLARSSVITATDFYAAPLAAFTWRGALTCLPQNASSLVVYYNRDLFAAAGLAEPVADWSWTDFVHTARALTRDRDGDGQVDQYGLGVEPSLLRLAPFIWQNGGELVDDPVAPTRLALREPRALAALRWFADLQRLHKAAPDRVAETVQDSESRFIAGTTAMLLNSRRGTPAYRQITSFDWDVAPLPRGTQTAGVLHSDGYCVARAARDKAAAWAFVEFANSPAGQRLVAASGRTVPSLRAVAASPAFLDPTQPPHRSQIFLDGIDQAHAVPLLSGWEQIERVAGEEVARAFYGEIEVEEAARLAVERSAPYFEQPSK